MQTFIVKDKQKKSDFIKIEAIIHAWHSSKLLKISIIFKYNVVARACFCNLFFFFTLLKDVIEQSSSIVDNKKEVLTSTNKKIVKPIFSEAFRRELIFFLMMEVYSHWPLSQLDR